MADPTRIPAPHTLTETDLGRRLSALSRQERSNVCEVAVLRFLDLKTEHIVPPETRSRLDFLDVMEDELGGLVAAG